MEYDPNQTAAYLAGKVDEYVKQQARDTVFQNVKADRFARYARIPDGHACDFCRMLASRGFVYRSQEKAGGDAWHGSEFDSFHPYCNCQIAVAFDPSMVYYYKNRVKVSRGYSSPDAIVASGRDGSLVPREVDIDELFAEYLKAGKSYKSGSRYRDYMGNKVFKLTADKLADYQDMLAGAKTVEELHAIGGDIVAEINAKGTLDSKQWAQLSSQAQRLERELSSRSAVLIERPFSGFSTISEAEQAAARFVDTGAYKAKIDLGGMDVDAANSMLKALDAVFSSYDVGKLRSVQRMNKRSNAFKGTTAEAAYQWLVGDLYYNADYVKTAKAMAKHRAEAKDLTDTVLGGDLDKLRARNAGNQAKLEYIDALERTGRSTVSSLAGERFEELTYAHELGHMLHDKLFRKTDFDFRASKDKFSGGISAYATTDIREYVAESFAAFYAGETSILDPELVALFEEMMI